MGRDKAIQYLNTKQDVMKRIKEHIFSAFRDMEQPIKDEYIIVESATSKYSKRLNIFYSCITRKTSIHHFTVKIKTYGYIKQLDDILRIFERESDFQVLTVNIYAVLENKVLSLMIEIYV